MRTSALKGEVNELGFLNVNPVLFMTRKPNENLFDENHLITSHREAVVRLTSG